MSNCSAKFNDHLTFEWVLDHQIQLAMRYRYFISIVMVTNGKGKISIRRLLGQTVRDCDLFFDLDEESAILMPHTSQDEAYVAVNRYKEKCNDAAAPHFSIVSYPADATTAATMLETSKRLISKARHSGLSIVMKEKEGGKHTPFEHELGSN